MKTNPNAAFRRLEVEFPKHPVLLGPNEPEAWNDAGTPTAGLGYTLIPS